MLLFIPLCLSLKIFIFCFEITGKLLKTKLRLLLLKCKVGVFLFKLCHYLLGLIAQALSRTSCFLLPLSPFSAPFIKMLNMSLKDLFLTFKDCSLLVKYHFLNLISFLLSFSPCFWSWSVCKSLRNLIELRKVKIRR